MSKNLTTRLNHHEINSVLRGIAIGAVIAIHILANIPHAFQTTSPFWPYAVLIDQLSRFCVPLFVMLSGYGFWEKYQKTEFHPVRFWQRQAMKLLPAYILVSVISYVIFWLIPTWRNPLAPQSLLVQLFTGQADYQLYFVPAIFQLYLLFPVLRSIVQKLPWLSLAVALGFQVWLYTLYNAAAPTQFIHTYLFTDQQQYVWFFTWIGYFFLGMHLSRISALVARHRGLMVALAVAVLITWLMVISRATNAVVSGIDPIVALRSTHIDLMFYATLVSIWLFTMLSQWQISSRKILRPLLILGQYSYPIYLWQTMILRIMFAL
jgi:probable poly-beta-1,6-N-acetyl-D-glucosamine export protein